MNKEKCLSCGEIKEIVSYDVSLNGKSQGGICKECEDKDRLKSLNKSLVFLTDCLKRILTDKEKEKALNRLKQINKEIEDLTRLFKENKKLKSKEGVLYYTAQKEVLKENERTNKNR